MSHTLIDGPPGLGKTTIASAIAKEMDVMYTVNVANIRSIKNIIPYLMGLEGRSVLFIDEIHRLPASRRVSVSRYGRLPHGYSYRRKA